MTMNIMRWVIGDCNLSGFETLKESINRVKSLYPEMELIICHNNLKSEQLEFIKKLDTPLFDQTSRKYHKTPEKAEWLLYPPRLRLKSHEIRIDNDLILTKRHPVIDEFLSRKDMLFATIGFKKSVPKYGSYNDCVPIENGALNSGICGFPPHFRLGDEIRKFYKKFGERPYRHTNPQGILAYIIKTQKYKLISNEDIRILRCIDPLVQGAYGYHLVGVNRFKHRAWEELKWQL